MPVPLSRGTIALPWQSRQELLDQFRHLDSMRPVLDAFEAVGTSEPVTLTEQQKGELLGVIEFWARQGPGATPSCRTESTSCASR